MQQAGARPVSQPPTAEWWSIRGAARYWARMKRRPGFNLAPRPGAAFSDGSGLATTPPAGRKGCRPYGPACKLNRSHPHTFRHSSSGEWGELRFAENIRRTIAVNLHAISYGCL